SMLAGNSLTLGAATVRQATAVKGANVSSAFSQTQNYTSSISAGGNAVLAALGGDLKSAGATIDSTGNMVLSAAKSLDLGSVTDSSSHDISGSKSGFLTHSSFIDKGSLSIERGSNVTSGGTLTGLSGGDMSLKGLIGAQGNVSLSAGGNLTLEATKTQSEASASHHVAGISLSSQGAQGTLGYGMLDDKSSSSSTVWTPSVLASLGGSVALNAGKALTIDGSALSAANDLTLSGSSISLLAKENSQTQSMAHKDKTIGQSIGLSPSSVVGQVVNSALAATQASGKGSGTLAALNALQAVNTASGGLVGAMGPKTDADHNLELIGVQAGVGYNSNKRDATQTHTTVEGAKLTAGGTTTLVARGDDASDATNGNISATAAQISSSNIVLAAKKDIDLHAGYDTSSSESHSSSKSAFVGANASIGTSGAGVSVTASVGGSKTHVTTSSATAVDTKLTATNGVTITTPGAVTLDGAEVSGKRIDVSAGSLSITSSQNRSDYKSTSSQFGASLSVPVFGAGGKTGGGASYGHQTITDHFVSTGDVLSGLYAGEGGLGVDVEGGTTLKAGVLSSTADAALNHLKTGSLTTESLENVSQWELVSTGMSFSGGAGMMGSSMGPMGMIGAGLAKGASGMIGGGRSHDETSESQSAITGNISIEAGSRSGSYETDVAKANGHLENKFDAQALSNQAQIQRLGSQLVGEFGGQIADNLDAAGIKGFGAEDLSNAWGRIALETLGNTAVAAASGGNIGVAAASTALSDAAAIASRDWVLNLTQLGNADLSKFYANVISNAIASGAGAATGALVGGVGNSSVEALNGAGFGSAMQQFNQAGEPDAPGADYIDVDKPHDIHEYDKDGKPFDGSEPGHKGLPSYAEVLAKTVSNMSTGDKIDYALQAVGFMPGPIGMVADTLHLGLALAKGDYISAAGDAFGIVTFGIGEFGPVAMCAAKLAKERQEAKAIAKEKELLELIPGTRVVPASEHNVVWGKGISGQGYPFEDFLEKELPAGSRLPELFRTIDFFDESTGLAVSAKTMETMTPSRMKNPRRVYYDIKRNIDTLEKFSGYGLSGRSVESSKIIRRELDLAIPYETGAAQMDQIKRAYDYAAQKGIELKI
ncbi:endonuclease toxin domain-containing protein, partial [Asaia spathodeae]